MELNFQYQTDNMALPVILGKIALTMAPTVIGAIQKGKAKDAQRRAEAERIRQEQLLKNLENNRQEIINPFENLSVATKAAEMQMEGVDDSLAMALDTLQATGYGSGAATALAREANKAKMKISSDIQKQEVQNQKLQAQGRIMEFQVREQREMQKMNRVAGLADAAYNQGLQYQSDANAALASGLSNSATLGMSMLNGLNAPQKQGTTGDDTNTTGGNKTTGGGTFTGTNYTFGQTQNTGLNTNNLTIGSGGGLTGNLGGNLGLPSLNITGGPTFNKGIDDYNNGVPPAAGMTWDFSLQRWTY